ncbi:MAG TPA: hypothetical protein VGL53_23245 [Bryobacteraceae bacterium]|jgi:hypothetical protein
MNHVLACLIPAALIAEAAPSLERSHSEFTFHLDVPYPQAAPLFGALAEKKWDPEWNPEFLYPAPAADEEGSVFVIARNGHHSTWTTTVFDLERGHIQYLYFIEGVMVTRIDIHLSKPTSGGTDARVLYERTALDAAANAHVKTLGEHDGLQGPHWKQAIEKSVTCAPCK